MFFWLYIKTHNISNKNDLWTFFLQNTVQKQNYHLLDLCNLDGFLEYNTVVVLLPRPLLNLSHMLEYYKKQSLLSCVHLVVDTYTYWNNDDFHFFTKEFYLMEVVLPVSFIVSSKEGHHPKVRYLLLPHERCQSYPKSVVDEVFHWLIIHKRLPNLITLQFYNLLSLNLPSLSLFVKRTTTSTRWRPDHHDKRLMR